jgi:hypothetical protein
LTKRLLFYLFKVIDKKAEEVEEENDFARSKVLSLDNATRRTKDCDYRPENMPATGKKSPTRDHVIM